MGLTTDYIIYNKSRKRMMMIIIIYELKEHMKSGDVTGNDVKDRR